MVCIGGEEGNSEETRQERNTLLKNTEETSQSILRHEPQSKKLGLYKMAYPNLMFQHLHVAQRPRRSRVSVLYPRAPVCSDCQEAKL